MRFSFDDLMGNAVTLSLIRRSLEKDNFRQVSIFSGPLGTGKTTSAIISAMRLVCQSPVGSNPCCKCDICRANMKGLQEGTGTSWIKLINLGRVTNLDDVNTLIEEIFKFQSTSQRQVFLLEEVHALRGVKNGFTALLSEIDRISPNTYLICTTTELHNIREELRSRSINFEFRRLGKDESSIFIKSLTAKRGARISQEVEDIINKQCRGIPRQIEKIVQFILDNEASIEEVKEFLQVISDYAIGQLFLTLKRGEFAKGMIILDNLLEGHEPKQLFQAISNFLAQVAFLLSGAKSTFSREERDLARAVFDWENLGKVHAALEHEKIQSESELILAMVRVSNVLAQKKEVSVITEKRLEAAKERANVVIKEQTKEAKLTPLSLKQLKR